MRGRGIARPPPPIPATHTRLADGDRTDTGHHLALRQVTVADDALAAVLGLQMGMLAEKVRDLGHHRPRSNNEVRSCGTSVTFKS
jgi:hypothetical protein